jgi:hypothetical protein
MNPIQPGFPAVAAPGAAKLMLKRLSSAQYEKNVVRHC